VIIDERVIIDEATRASRARASYFLRARLLEQIGRRLETEKLETLLVKGAALAMTVYHRPWDRQMQDIDLLVRTDTRERLIRLLEEMRFCALYDAGRPLTREALGEVAFRTSCGGASILLEVHTQLDKVVSRPVDYGGIFARAHPVPECPGFLVPSPEDHALLVALHFANTEFSHPPAFRDLALLLGSGLDHGLLIERARRWRLGTAMYVTLSTLKVAGADVPEELLAAFAPGRARLAALKRFYRLGPLPVAKAAFRLGLPWICRQTPLRDDLAGWCIGLARYAGLRTAERLLWLER